MAEEVNRTIQEVNLDRLARNPKGFQFTDTFFPYTSGEIGPYYVQSGAVMANGRDYHNACEDFHLFVFNTLGAHYGAGEKIITGGESRDWMFSMPISAKLELPHVMIYKDGKTVGAEIKRNEAVHIADLNNEGSSPRDLWVPVIKKEGGTIKHIFFYVDRMEEGVKVMEELGLERHALVPLDEHAWDYLQKQGVVTPEVYKNLRERGTTKEQRDAWARTMLRSNQGLETLASLSNNDKTRDKAKKILYQGYHDMRHELIEAMNRFHLLLPGISNALLPNGI